MIHDFLRCRWRRSGTSAQCRQVRCWLLVPAVIMLMACAANPAQVPVPRAQAPVFDDAAFGPAPPLAEAADIFRLTESQARAFWQYFHDPLRAGIPAHRRVFDYLENVTSDFSYQGDTLTAAEALKRKSGNCLSLAILTTALAEAAGVEIGYQLVDAAPVFESRGEVIYRGVHARSILYDPAWEPEQDMLIVRRPGLQVDYFPSGNERFIGNLPRQQFVAMYYSNLAADAIAAGDLSQAFWLLRKSLEYAPDNDTAVNMMAVVYRRAGDDARAEAVYRYGMAQLSDQVSLLRNYRILLTEQGRNEEAAEIGAMLERLAEPNPFDWIHAAQQAHDDGNYHEAVSLYRKAVAIAPYLHEGYFGMARSYFELGDKARAEKELARAILRANRHATRFLYKAKLMALRGEQVEDSGPSAFSPEL